MSFLSVPSASAMPLTDTTGNISANKTSVARTEITAIANASVGTVQLQDKAVTTQKLANGAVTNPVIAKNSVNSTDIGSGTITGDNIADSTITSTKIARGAVSLNVGLPPLQTGFQIVGPNDILNLTTVSCPPDHPLPINRFITSLGEADFFIQQDYPAGNPPTGWTIIVHNPTSDNEQINLGVFCATILP